MAISGNSSMDSLIQLIGILVIFVFVLVITYATTRWIANYQKTTGKNRNIRVIETFRISNSKYIQIIQTGNKYLAIGVSKDNITLLTELSKDEITDFTADNQQTKDESFAKILDKFKDMKPKK